MRNVVRWLGASSCAFLLTLAPGAFADGGKRAVHRAQGARWLAAGPSARPPSPTGFPLRLPSFLAWSSGKTRGTSPRAALGRHEDPRSDCGTRCLDRRGATDRARAFTAAALAGVTASGVGAGLVLVLTRSTRESLLPVLRLKLSGQRAAASAAWRF